MNITCIRCNKVGPLEVTDEHGNEVTDANVDVKGLLTYICVDCMTSDEARHFLAQSAAALLDAAEEAVEGIEMVMERIPGVKDDPEFKASLAEAMKQRDLARANLEALTNMNLEDDTDAPDQT